MIRRRLKSGQAMTTCRQPGRRNLELARHHVQAPQTALIQQGLVKGIYLPVKAVWPIDP
jgi:hypothetical protein